MTKNLNFWVMPNADLDTKKLIDRELSRFTLLHPHIQVTSRVIPWLHSWPEIMKACKEKFGVDALMLGTTWVQTLAYLKALKPLDGEHINTGGFIREYLRLSTHGKRLWALPWFCEANVMFYRKDHLEQAGTKPENIRTWNDFTALCAKLKKTVYAGKTTAPVGFSIQPDQTFAQNLSCFIWSHGGDFISANGKSFPIADKKALRGFTTLLSLISRGYVSKDSLNISTGEVIGDFFSRGAFTFIISSPWPIRLYLSPESPLYIGKEKAGKFGIMNLPGGPAGRFNFTGGSTLAVTSFSAHQEEAVMLVKFLASAQSQERYCKSIGMLPARLDTKIHLPLLKGREEVFEAAVSKYGKSFPPHPLWGSVERIVISGMSYALSGYCKDRNTKRFVASLREVGTEIDRIFKIFGE
jgi:multiple sugar transport system substrate-binding protein